MSDNTVTIPADVAKRMADWMRHNAVSYNSRAGLRDWADLLDPTPPTLRERVAEALRDFDGELDPPDSLRAADYALAVVWVAIKALPYVTVPWYADPASGASEKAYRERDLLCLIDGMDS
jgi:hypothetical protein